MSKPPIIHTEDIFNEYYNQFEASNLHKQLSKKFTPKPNFKKFITKHYWGYTKINDRKTTKYEVTHPKWEHYKVINTKIEFDFGLTYEKLFEFLNESQPKSVMLTKGSFITVEGKKR